MNYFAFDLGGTDTKWAVLDDDYRIKRRGEFPTPYESSEELIRRMAETVRMQEDSFASIGISCPGTFYEWDAGVIHGGGFLDFLDGVPLCRELENAYGIPCFIENDGICCALGEYVDGVLKNTRCGVVFVLGTGVGGGIIINGRAYKGAHSFAGEFSFIRTDLKDENSRLGNCGGWRNGLFAEIMKEKNLSEDEEIDGYTIFQWIEQDDPEAKRALKRYTDFLACQIWNLQAILDPEIVAVGGGISRQPVLIQAIQNSVDELMSKNEHKRFPAPLIQACAHGNDANLIGAIYNNKIQLGDRMGITRK